jgi:hypothetical protein
LNEHFLFDKLGKNRHTLELHLGKLGEGYHKMV